MKKAKVLFPIIGLMPISVAGALTGMACSCKSSQSAYIIAAEKDINIVGNEFYNYFEFTLNQDLQDGQTLETDLVKTDYFTFGSVVVENRLVKIAAVFNHDKNVTQDITWKNDITFTCKNGDGKTVWTQKIVDCSATYSPNIFLVDSKDGLSYELENSNKTIIGHFTFKLGEQLDEILELKPYVTAKSGQTNYSVDETRTCVTTSGTNVDFQLVVNKTEAFAIGDQFNFDLQFECTVKGEVWTYWQSNKFSGMSLAYNANEIALDPEEDFILEGTATTGQTLTGIKSTSKAWAANSTVNTLYIPARSANMWIRTIGDGTKPVALPSSIQKIRIGGLGLQTIDSFAFCGNTNIKYIDMSVITDEVKSLSELLTFNEDSFSGWTQDGRVIYNKDLSQYKRHIIKEKLYKGGLKNQNWFGVNKVYNIDQLREAAYMGGTIQLQNDITINVTNEFRGQIEFYTSSILDLNSFKIVPNKPIFNTEAAEFATIGVWDCELLVTDSSSNHNGGVEAYDISAVNDPSKTDAKRPDAPKEGELPQHDNIYWEWSADKSGNYRYRTRENRCFYVRSDIPTRAKGTLEIVAGKFKGDCTCIMNYNTTVYIEDGYITEPHDTYTGKYAPEFELYSVNCDFANQYKYAAPCSEMLNCWEDTVNSGEATFQVWGGKFHGKSTRGQKTDVMKFFDPREAPNDKTPVYDDDWEIKKDEKGNPVLQKANWCRNNIPEKYEGTILDILYSTIKQVESGSDYYMLATPNWDYY